MNSATLPSTQPYLLRALHEWCSDNGFTPYLAVRVDESVQVPREYVQNGEIVLNVSHDATVNLRLGNEEIEFQARFGGVPRRIVVPVGRVLAIYARENGQGMAFAVSDEPGAAAAEAQPPSQPSSTADAASDSQPEPASPDAAVPEASDAAPKKARSTPRKAAAPRSSAPKAPPTLHAVPADSGTGGDDEPPPPAPPAGGKRPALRRVK